MQTQTTVQVTSPPPYNVVAQPVYAVQPNVVVAAPVILRFTDMPVQMVCPNCRQQIVTRTMYEIGGMVWLAALAIFFVTLCCCWIAFLIDGLKDVVHTCPNCNTMVGRYTRL